MKNNREGQGISERFLSKVKKDDPSGCWIWIAGKKSDGYGCFQLSTGAHGAHRISYLIFVGSIPDGLCVLHHCDVRACVNPDHLYAGTNDDNVRDKVVRQRQPHGEDNHLAKLTVEQVKEIRALYPSGGTMQQIADRFGTALANVYNIVRRKSWRHLD